MQTMSHFGQILSERGDQCPMSTDGFLLAREYSNLPEMHLYFKSWTPAFRGADLDEYGTPHPDTAPQAILGQVPYCGTPRCTLPVPVRGLAPAAAAAASAVS